MKLDRVGSYRVVRELGRGAFGAVFLATKDGLAREVALKVLLPGADETTRARFKLEAKIASQLEHPNVVRCSDVGRDSERGLLYLALDFVEGGSLKDRLKLAGALPPADAAGVLADVCAGLHYAHQRGVLHRDLKPDNVLLNIGGEASVTDFGLARDLASGRLTGEGVVVGTPNYFPPEILDGGDASPRSDIYGIGCLLYECLTAKRAFPGTDFYLVTSAIRANQFIPLRTAAPKTPTALAAICRRALALDPAARFEDAEELGQALRVFSRTPSVERAVSGRQDGVATWQLGVLFVGLFLLASALTATIMIALEPAPAPAVATASPTRSRSAPLPSPSPTALPETPFDLEDASEEALGQLGKSGNTAAAAILARRAIGRWDHDRARLWIPLAGSEHSLLTARAKQADLDERDAIRGPRLLLRQLQPREALTQLQLLLERHPRGPKLRTQEAKALLWLGRSRAAISALDKGATGPQAMEIRGVANENLQAGLEDTSARATLHSAWDCYRGGGWTWDKSRRTIRARGVGLGPFGLCGLLDRASERQEGAFKSSVEVRLERDQPGKYGGLLLLKDAGTGLLVYLYYAPESIPPEYAERVAKFPPGEVTMLRVAYLYREEWQPFAEDQAFAHNPTGWHSLEVSYEGSQIQVTVDGVKGEPIQLHGLASGRAGVLKWYDHTLEFRNFKTGP